ncbi:hypothetical protein D3C87_1238540 [compost metagenome]
MPGAIKRLDAAQHLVGCGWDARVCNTPPAVVVPSGSADSASRPGPRRHAIVPGGQVVVSLATLHAAPRISYRERALSRGAAADDGPGCFVVGRYCVLRERLAGLPRICDALAGAVRARDRKTGALPLDDAEFVAVLGRSGVARIGDAVGALAWVLLSANRPARVAPSPHTIGLSIGPLRRLLKPRVSRRECTCLHRGLDHVVAQMAILDRQLVQAAPVAAGLDEGEPYPGLPLQ